MKTDFVSGELYTREDVAERIGLPHEKRRGGDWSTGYSEWNGAAYIFTNVGVAGRTGHDYPNRWDGKNLKWFGKTNSSRGQPRIERMISNTQPVHVFWRGADREAFSYAGPARAIAVEGDRPLQVTWSFEAPAEETFLTADLASTARVPHFDREFARFSGTIYPRFGDGPFTSFLDGAARQWESYKPRVRQVALARLEVEQWTQSKIGSGQLLERLISAIEIDGDEQNRNNLVPWQGRFGPGSVAHAALIRAREQPGTRQRFDQWLFDAFVAGSEPGLLFERFRAIAGDGYPLAAYVFFLLDIDRYAPIAPQTFDRAFKQLGIDLTTSSRCSWSNYVAYNKALEAVRREIARKPGFEHTRHIDAHSFCWMLVRMADALSASELGSASIVRHASARRRAIYTMADNAAHAASASGKQTVLVNKNKEIHHTREELVKVVEALIEEQKGLCALTGLPMQWRGDHEDGELCASLDRIDSNGPYEKGNLQVVCWFANRWKGATTDGEFRRLIAMLRDRALVMPA